MTDREMDIRLAKALGYDIRFWDDRWYFLLPDQVEGFPCFYPVSEHYPLHTWGSSSGPAGERAQERCWNQHCPHFTTDGNAMLALIDAMREREWYWWGDIERGDVWHYKVLFWKSPEHDDNEAVAPTLPAAVAAAALKALEGDE